MTGRFRTMGRQLAVAMSSMFAWVAGVAAAAEQAPTAEAEVADPTGTARNAMVARQIEARGVRSPAVLQAMRAVPRHEFVPEAVRARAYQDSPLPIGEGQTISQPYIVALMTELAAPRKGARVLEIGTGSGYQAAVLAELGAQVHSIEIVEPLGRQAAETLKRLGYATVKTRIGDGYRGWPQAAPFDAILVTAAPPRIPEPLKQQLAVGGRLVVPVGEDEQELLVLTRTKTGFEERRVLPVRFVPMTGEAQKPQPSLPGRQ
jgi:protein-L-isoaspartate(D-aspartate) O-methyltransferase